jgi:hypothetical protein
VVTMELRGVQDALNKLQAVRRSVQRRICRKGVKAAAQRSVRIGKPFVPKGENKLLQKALGWKLLRGAAAKVGPRTKVFRRMVNGRMVDPGRYGYIVDVGSQPHVLVPKRKARLAFRGRQGRLVVVKSVNHPGTRATGFLGKIQRVSLSAMGQAFASTVEHELAIEAAKARPSEAPDG